MYLSLLTLTNFRNLAELELELPPGVVVFFGPNAQGKTTLLEAVYLLALARSFRTENEREVLNCRAAADGGHGLVRISGTTKFRRRTASSWPLIWFSISIPLISKPWFRTPISRSCELPVRTEWPPNTSPVLTRRVLVSLGQVGLRKACLWASG